MAITAATQSPTAFTKRHTTAIPIKGISNIYSILGNQTYSSIRFMILYTARRIENQAVVAGFAIDIRPLNDYG